MIINVTSIDLADDRMSHKVHISTEEFAAMAIQNVLTRNEPGTGVTFDTREVGDDLYYDLAKRRAGTWVATFHAPFDYTPRAQVTFADKNWAVVRWAHNLRMKGEEMVGTAFLFRRDEKEEFKYFEPSENCIIDPSSGDIRMWATNDPDCIAYFPANQSPWPRPLKEPRRYAALGMLNWLMKADDENPLTMLAGIQHQPCKGSAKQVVRRLKKIHAMILKEGGVRL